MKTLLALFFLIPNIVLSEDYNSTMKRFCSYLSNEITGDVDFNNFMSKSIINLSNDLGELDSEKDKNSYDKTWEKLQSYIQKRNEQQEVLLRKSTVFSNICNKNNSERLLTYQQMYRDNYMYENLD